MGSLLHKLWDETLAGPTPDSGLGKLRKYNSLSARSAAAPLPDLVPPPRDDTALLPISRKFTGSAHRNLTVSVDSPPRDDAAPLPISRKFTGSAHRNLTVSVDSPPRDDAAPLPISRKFTGSAHRNLTVSVDSPPSPSGSSAPSSPFSPTTPGGNLKKLARRKSASAASRSSEPKTPTGYDWIMLSALDR